MNYLNLGHDLAALPWDDFLIPEESLTHTFAILAQRGAGKTYVAGVVEEEFAKHHLPFVVLDPVGVHYGIRSTADGKRESPYPVVVFGGRHADIPLDEHMGEKVAEAIIEENISCIIDLTELPSKAAWRRFVHDFCLSLYKMNSSPRHIFIEEATEFVPQTRRPEMQRAYEAVERMVRLGRNRGLGVTLIAQRAAQIAKDVLYALDVLIVLRTVGTLDRKAITDLLQENVGPDQQGLVKEMRQTMPSLPNGTAWVWSPEFLKCFMQVTIRERETYHGGATPTFEKTKLVQAKPDVSKLRERFATTPVIADVSKKAEEYATKLAQDLTDQVASLTQENQSLMDHQKRMAEELTTLRQEASNFQTIRKLLAVGPFQTTVVYGEGDAPPPIDMQEIIRQVQASLPVMNGQVVQVTPPEALRKKYLDVAVAKLYERIAGLDTNPKRAMEVLLSNDRYWSVNAVSLAGWQSDAGGTRARVSKALQELATAGLATKGGSGRSEYKAAIEGGVRATLAAHSPTDQEVQAVVQNVLAKVVTG